MSNVNIFVGISRIFFIMSNYMRKLYWWRDMYKDRLKYLRDEKEINQDVIADYIGIHKGLYSQYETEYALMPF